MKRFIKFVIIAVIIVSAAFGVYKITSEYRVGILADNIECNIILKGCENSIGLTAIGKNFYVAFENSIVEIDESGKEKVILKDKNLNIEDIEGINGELYFISGKSLYKTTLEGEKFDEVVKNIPNEGEKLERKLLALGEDLFLSISSTTNSGVVEKAEDVKDVPPYDVTFGEWVNKGLVPFKGYGEAGEVGEKIRGSEIGNSAIYKIDVSSKKYKLYASGLKNVVGWDYNSSNEIFIGVKGIEDGGLRGIYRDRDYIFALKKDGDYGFPDFSGGDFISSPRFTKEKEVKPLLESSKKKVVPSPLYQHNSVNSINEIAIDREGSVFAKDSKVFYDSKEGVVGTLSNNGVYTRVLKLNEKSNVVEIKYVDGKILVLDSGIGSLYEVEGKTSLLGFNLSPIVWIIILSFLIVLLVVVVLKVMKKYKK